MRNTECGMRSKNLHPKLRIPNSELRIWLPCQLHLSHDLLRQLFDGLLLRGYERLPAFGHIIRLLAKIHEQWRGGNVFVAHDQVAAAIDPIRLYEEVGFDVARLTEAIVSQDALTVGDESHG